MKGIWQCQGTFLSIMPWGLGGEVLLASHGWGPGMLLNTLQGTVWGLPHEKETNPDVHRVKVRNPAPFSP